MSDPLVPNYKKDVGRLATDRYDFEEHIKGLDFRHNADAIDVIPNIIVGSNNTTNVMETLTALRDATLAPVINDATTASKGIIQLAGDIAGAATNVVVTRIQSKPISTLTPSHGDVLTWDGYSNVWNPAGAINVFNAGGDLAGSNILQNVIGLTGTQHVGANYKTVNCNFSVFDFVTSARPHLTQETVSNDDGNSFIIMAQSSTSSNKNGGPVIIAGGAPGAGGRRGGVRLQFTNSIPVGYPTTSFSGTTSTNMVQLSEVSSGRKVLSLCHAAELNTIDMPASTGDMVMYIRNAATNPGSGSPSNGAIFYASDGNLWIKQQDGNNFQIGTNPNPNIWGSVGQQIYTFRSSVVSIGGSGVLAFDFPLQNNTCTGIDVNLVGKRNGSTDSAQFNLRMAYSRHGGVPVPLGSVTTLDSRTSGAASLWNLPIITLSGNTLQIFTGSESGTSIVWLVVTQLTMSLNNI